MVSYVKNSSRICFLAKLTFLPFSSLSLLFLSPPPPATSLILSACCSEWSRFWYFSTCRKVSWGAMDPSCLKMGCHTHARACESVAVSESSNRKVLVPTLPSWSTVARVALAPSSRSANCAGCKVAWCRVRAQVRRVLDSRGFLSICTDTWIKVSPSATFVQKPCTLCKVAHCRCRARLYERKIQELYYKVKVADLTIRTNY